MVEPTDLGAPAKFSHWRDGQFDSVMQGVDSDKRFIAHAMATGGGKSLTAIGHALITDARVCYLTATKALQSQLLTDFGEMGLVDVRGQNSYQCLAAPDFGITDTIMVDEGPCHGGLHCPMRDGSCLYYGAIARAKQAQLVVTNYKLWMYINKFSEGLGDFDLLVLDEAHNAHSEVSDFLTIALDLGDVQWLLNTSLPEYDNMDEWRRWAGRHGARLELRIDGLSVKLKNMRSAGQKVSRMQARELKMMRQLRRSLNELEHTKGQWIIEWVVVGKRVLFSPLWPSEYTESALFLDIPKVLLMSATLRPKTLNVLGISTDTYDFFEAPSTFPPATRPVYFVPTVSMSYKTGPQELRQWLDRIDEIITKRLDRKGIIHTVSYKLAQFIMQNSRHKNIFFTHDSRTTRSVVEDFKQRPAPAVLVSPSVTTGWDFPGDESEYSIIAKLPFPDLRSTILRARMEADPEYVDYITAQTITQMAGRSHRSETDRSETFVIDNNWQRFITTQQRRALFPEWFLAACKTVPFAPEPHKKG